MEHQLAGCGCGIDVLRNALKGNVLLLQGGDCLNEMLEGAAEAIQPPHDERIPFTKV